jgi:formylmethanofuran dehydrogenase subunit E
MRRARIPSFAETVLFHGHSCPGLAIGYRVAVAALGRFGIARPADDELFCVVENDACGVDAVQFVAGCTVGKGNLILRDYGKQVFTFFHRETSRGLRFSAQSMRPPEPEGYDIGAIRNRMLEGIASQEERRLWDLHRGRKIRMVLQAPEEKVFEVREVPYVSVKGARIAESAVCARCGEKVMVTKTVRKGEELLCIPCAESR